MAPPVNGDNGADPDPDGDPDADGALRAQDFLATHHRAVLVTRRRDGAVRAEFRRVLVAEDRVVLRLTLRHAAGAAAATS